VKCKTKDGFDTYIRLVIDLGKFVHDDDDDDDDGVS